MLSSEIAVLKQAMLTERKKRTAILSADGQNLKILNVKSDTLISEMVRMEKERNDFLKANGMPESLTALEDNAETRVEGKNKSFLGLASNYRKVSHDLKAIVEENQRVLQTTSKSIQRMLVHMHSVATGAQSKTYAPAQSNLSKNKSTGSILVNANA